MLIIWGTEIFLLKLSFSLVFIGNFIYSINENYNTKHSNTLRHEFDEYNNNCLHFIWCLAFFYFISLLFPVLFVSVFGFFVFHCSLRFSVDFFHLSLYFSSSTSCLASAATKRCIFLSLNSCWFRRISFWKLQVSTIYLK